MSEHKREELRSLLSKLTDRELDAFALIVRELAAKKGPPHRRPLPTECKA